MSESLARFPWMPARVQTAPGKIPALVGGGAGGNRSPPSHAMAGGPARLAASGIAAGLLIAAAVTRALGAALYGVSLIEPPRSSRRGATVPDCSGRDRRAAAGFGR